MLATTKSSLTSTRPAYQEAHPHHLAWLIVFKDRLDSFQHVRWMTAHIVACLELGRVYNHEKLVNFPKLHT